MGAEKRWIPISLRTWYIVLLVGSMLGIAVAIEIALHFSQEHSGWATDAANSQTGVRHFAFTLPPTIVAMIIIGLWSWTNIEIQRMQPYIDLAHGNAKSETTLLLDYTRTNTFLIWMHAASNKHWVVTLASIIALAGLAFQPLAAGWLTVRNIWLPLPPTSVRNLKTVGLSPDFSNLVPFVSAAGYAEAQALYALPDPAFIKDGWTVQPFVVPTNQTLNGTIFANTVGIKTWSGCEAADSVGIAQDPRGGVDLNATWGDCTSQFFIDTNATQQWGVQLVTQCLTGNVSTTPDEYKPVVFWVFDSSQALAAVTFCQPAISVANVDVEVNCQDGSLQNVTVSNVPWPGGDNITGPPMNGIPLNGIAFNLTNPDRYVLGRENATQSILPAAIWQSAVMNNGTDIMFNNSGTGWVELTDQVYSLYLALVASSVYFVDSDPSSHIELKINTVQSRILLSPIATHILAAALVILGCLGFIVHLYHKKLREPLALHHSPGTIASAVAITANSDFGNLMHGKQQEKEIVQALRNKRFKLDRSTGKIVLDREGSLDDDPEKLDESDGLPYIRRNTWRSLRTASPPASEHDHA
ncbi:hypothetical protein SISSUDRAFT_318122 [Sistotremastrum suecicum HHB10207 ss-3]|uniref:Uncharacterized protein n=1 Tax=Sistotremastrum suecicum HHB10207 ss-3 TaxID=1314776 RepID=A0A165Z9L4_9AGAM|nr:hypothetical protein SISSUDRAFT_318122 [Sistotremastrum suecicum HHB10207 ss-3]